MDQLTKIYRVGYAVEKSMTHLRKHTAADIPLARGSRSATCSTR